MIAGVLSTLEMHCLMKAGLCSGATESTWILDKLLVLSMDFIIVGVEQIVHFPQPVIKIVIDSFIDSSPTVEIYERKRQESVEWT